MQKQKKSKFQRDIDERELSSKIKLHIDQESRNLFQSDVRRRKAMSRGGRRVAILAVILVALFFWTWVFGNVSSSLRRAMIRPGSTPNHPPESIRPDT